MYAYAYMHVWICVFGDHKRQVSSAIPLYFMKQGLSLDPELAIGG